MCFFFISLNALVPLILSQVFPLLSLSIYIYMYSFGCLLFTVSYFTYQSHPADKFDFALEKNTKRGVTHCELNLLQ